MDSLKQDVGRIPPRLPGCFIAILAAAGFLTTTQAQTLPGWDLVWSDEFSEADGSPPNTHKWGYDIGGWGWGNGELQYYTDRTNNVRVVGGNLVIEAHEESYGGNSYTSARLLTKGRRFASWTYGRMEARIKIPRGQGIWPAFWMLGDDFDTVGWPECGEIDIMENIGVEPRTVHGTVHGPFNWGGHYYSGGSLTHSADLADDFHVYAIEWDPDEIRWYFDDTQYYSATPTTVSGVWVFDHNHFFLLNVAVGGNWPGYPDETTVFPQQMLVDYVRVYTPLVLAPFAVDAARVGNDIQISFPTQNGVDYQVGYKDSLIDSDWTAIETVAGDGTTKTVSYPVTNPLRFYTVEVP